MTHDINTTYEQLMAELQIAVDVQARIEKQPQTPEQEVDLDLANDDVKLLRSRIEKLFRDRA